MLLKVQNCVKLLAHCIQPALDVHDSQKTPVSSDSSCAGIGALLITNCLLELNKLASVSQENVKMGLSTKNSSHNTHQTNHDTLKNRSFLCLFFPGVIHGICSLFHSWTLIWIDCFGVVAPQSPPPRQ